MRYFAFGSNMLNTRLTARVGAVPPGVVGEIGGYQLRFHKRSGDGSGKCDAYHTNNPNDTIYGVVYHLSAEQKLMLDAFEGAGYQVVDQSVAIDGDNISAYMYVAELDYIDSGLVPYHWYKQFVLTGAQESKLSGNYIRKIANVPSTADPDLARHLRNVAVLAEIAPIVNGQDHLLSGP